VTQVFLNYRTADEPYGVAMLERALSEKFGSSAVFYASKSIELGALWESAMFNAVADSDALLAIMGRNWLNAKDEAGVRLIDKEDDFVRREILTAVDANTQVIPVLLDIPRPTEQDLPAALHPLYDRQGIRIGFRSAQPDIDRLATKLRELIPALRQGDGKTGRAEPGRRRAAGDITITNKGKAINQTTNTFNAEQIRFKDFYAGPRTD
jgi:hypothetical protein